MAKKHLKISEIPKIERPRERLIAKGPENLKDLPRSELFLLRDEKPLIKI